MQDKNKLLKIQIETTFMFTNYTSNIFKKKDYFIVLL